MTLDREAARALFGEAPATASAGAPYAAEMRPAPFERTGARKGREGIDWRLVAPVGVAVVCIAALAIFALPRGDDAVAGRTVAATDLAAPPVTPSPVTAPAPAPMPMETAAVVTPEPVARSTAATPRPAAVRRAPARTVAAAAAPSAADAGVNVSDTRPAAPPAPSLGAPAAIELTPMTPPAPPPVIEPAPQP